MLQAPPFISENLHMATALLNCYKAARGQILSGCACLKASPVPKKFPLSFGRAEMSSVDPPSDNEQDLPSPTMTADSVSSEPDDHRVMSQDPDTASSAQEVVDRKNQDGSERKWCPNPFSLLTSWSFSLGQEQDRDWAKMSRDEKRHYYRCGDDFVELCNIPTWQQMKGVKDPQKLSPNTPNLQLNEKISLWRGDITKLEIDAIVNAANSSLLGGGGVDGAIHRAAGRSLLRECRTLDGCDPGETKRTGGHKLPAKHVLHTVGPMNQRRETLTSCYNSCLSLVLEHNIRSVAFCCIATGVYGYPNEEAAHVALDTVKQWLEKDDNADMVDRIIFCVFLDIDYTIYCQLLHHYFPRGQLEETYEESIDDHDKESTDDHENDAAPILKHSISEFSPSTRTTLKTGGANDLNCEIPTNQSTQDESGIELTPVDTKSSMDNENSNQLDSGSTSIDDQCNPSKSDHASTMATGGQSNSEKRFKPNERDD